MTIFEHQEVLHMADKTDKVTENVPGVWYVDKNCISCGLCLNEAPGVFQFNDEEKAYVFKQASADDASALSAMESCPVEAIGKDG